MKEINSLLTLSGIVTLIWFLNAMMRPVAAKPNSPRSVRWRLGFARVGSEWCWGIALGGLVLGGLPIVLLGLDEVVMSPAGMRVVHALSQSDLGIAMAVFAGFVAGSLLVRSVRG